MSLEKILGYPDGIRAYANLIKELYENLYALAESIETDDEKETERLTGKFMMIIMEIESKNKLFI